MANETRDKPIEKWCQKFEVGDLLLHYRYGTDWSHPDSGEVCTLISGGDNDKSPLSSNSLTILLNGEIVDTWRANVCHL